MKREEFTEKRIKKYRQLRVRTAFRMLPRRALTVLLLLVQLGFWVWLSVTSLDFLWLQLVMMLIGAGLSLLLIGSNEPASFKITWVFILLLFPMVGSVYYILFHSYFATEPLKRAVAKSARQTAALVEADRTEAQMLLSREGVSDQTANYLLRQGYPLYGVQETVYFPYGEAAFARLLDELEKAQKYIYLEFFIIGEGAVWDAVHEVLRRKAAEGVDVRVIYDDVGSLLTFEGGSIRKLKKEGIKCCVFNPLNILLAASHNNRDHRKIVVIDGNVAFTGGVNLADEYANIYKRFGEWKDTAVMVTGRAAQSFTAIFLQMWMLCRREKTVFMPEGIALSEGTATGYVQPYADSPNDAEAVGKTVLLQSIYSAQSTVYLCTPYLIIDDPIVEALKTAAKSGKQVHLVMPGIYDKGLVKRVSRSHFYELVEAGVHVYEYTPGFVHAKMIVADSTHAVVGSINMDYRSLYHSFECAIRISGAPCVREIEADFQKMIAASCKLTLKDCRKTSGIRESILRLFSPLM